MPPEAYSADPEGFSLLSRMAFLGESCFRSYSHDSAGHSHAGGLLACCALLAMHVSQKKKSELHKYLIAVAAIHGLLSVAQ